jgi:nucleoside-diphosphate-sugar epimerase/predicted dehydrogenase
VKRRVALLGAGYILESHVKALRALPQIEISSVSDVVAARAERAAATWGIPFAFGSIEAVANSDCEVVHVLLPPDAHFEAVRRLLDADKHILVEKPMTISVAHSEALEALAGSKARNLGVNHNFLFMPAFERLIRDLSSRQLGPIDHLAVDWHYCLPQLQLGPHNAWMLREPQNIAFEIGSHVAAFVVYLLGTIDRLSVVPSNPVDLAGGYRVWRHWNAVGSANGASFAISISLTAGHPHRRVRLRCLGSTADVDLDRDVYIRTASRSASGPLDAALTVRDEIRQQRQQWRGNLVRRSLGTLKKSASASPFQESIERSIRAYYAQLDGTPDARHRPGFGTEVTRVCEQMGQAVRVPYVVPHAHSSPPMRTAIGPTVLVVGGTGFIGRHLVSKLVQAGNKVRIVTRDAAAAHAELEHLDVEFAEGPYGNAGTIRSALSDVETVYHLGKCVGQRWEDYVAGDIEPTRALAEMALSAGVKRFVYTGTIDSYYSGEASDTITSDTPLDPRIAHRNHYARSKATCESLLLSLHRQHGLPLVIVRPGVVIGKGSAPAHWGVGMFRSDVAVEYWGDGRNSLPFVLVDDVAEAVFRAGTVSGIEGLTFLATDAPMLSARDYVAELSRALKINIDAKAVPVWKLYAIDVVKEALKGWIKHPNRRRPSYRDWQCRTLCARFDSSKTLQYLDWHPCSDRQRLIREGIDAAVAHYLGLPPSTPDHQLL